MKTKIMVALMSLSMLLGCAGRRHAMLNTNDNGVAHDDSTRGWFQSSVNPIELAEAYRIKKQADAYFQMMTNLSGRASVDGGGFLIAIVNNDQDKSLFVYHPEIPGMKLTVPPRGGFQIMPARDIPYQIVLYNMDGGIIKRIIPRYEYDFQEKISHKKPVGNFLVDLRITVDKIH